MNNRQKKKIEAAAHNVKYKAQGRMKARSEEMHKELDKIKPIAQIIDENQES